MQIVITKSKHKWPYKYRPQNVTTAYLLPCITYSKLCSNTSYC